MRRSFAAWLLLVAVSAGQPLISPTPAATSGPVATPVGEPDHGHQEQHEHEEAGHQHTTDCEHEHDVAPSARDESRPALQGFMLRARNEERLGVGIPVVWSRALALWMLVLALVPIYWLRSRRRYHP